MHLLAFHEVDALQDAIDLRVDCGRIGCLDRAEAGEIDRHISRRCRGDADRGIGCQGNRGMRGTWRIEPPENPACNGSPKEPDKDERSE